MIRKFAITAVLILAGSNLLWAKIKADDQAYFDGKFQQLAEEQAKQLKAQQDAFNAQLKQLADAQNAQVTELIKSQATLQKAVEAMQQTFNQLQIIISNLATSNTQDTLTLKQEIEQMRATLQASGGPGGAPQPRPVGYITTVGPDQVITVNLGSGNGLKSGSQLGVYKANDPNTRVGTLEVTDIIDQGNAHAKIKIMNAGYTPDFSDVVKPD